MMTMMIILVENSGFRFQLCNNMVLFLQLTKSLYDYINKPFIYLFKITHQIYNIVSWASFTAKKVKKS